MCIDLLGVFAVLYVCDICEYTCTVCVGEFICDAQTRGYSTLVKATALLDGVVWCGDTTTTIRAYMHEAQQSHTHALIRIAYAHAHRNRTRRG